MSKYFEHYVDEDGTVDDQLTLTSDAHASLTYDIEELVEKYTGESAFGKCSEIRNDMVDLIHQIINGEEESYPTLFQQFQKSLDLDIEEDYQLDERLSQFKEGVSDE